MLVGCARCDPPPRPRQPTLRVAPDPAAPASGRRVVAVGQIAQTWHDDQGELRRVLDQGPATVGRKKPPVFAQLYVELAPVAGAHTIVPAYLGGPAGDGTLYVAQVRGLTEHRVVATGDRWVRGSQIPEIAVTTDRPAETGDLVIALAGYDNVDQRDHSGFSHPPVGWIALGLNDDAANNVPSELCYRAAPADGAQAVTWTWTDPSVNVAAAVIAALR
jgi:hypothetical protein